MEFMGSSFLFIFAARSLGARKGESKQKKI